MQSRFYLHKQSAIVQVLVDTIEAVAESSSTVTQSSAGAHASMLVASR